MREVRDIPEISDGIADLFETAGFLDAESFANNSTVTIREELLKANAMLNLVDEVPSMEEIEQWSQQLLQARNKVSTGVFEGEGDDVNNNEGTVAYPLSDDFLKHHEINVASLPGLKTIGEEEFAEDKEPLQVQTIEDYKKSGSAIEPLTNDRPKGSLQMMSEGLNKGLDPSSRRYIRGVLHQQPQMTYIGAVAYLLMCVLLVCSVVPIVFILLKPDLFLWGLLTPALLIVSLFIYLAVARKSFCPVCRQKQFATKHCLKHVKAHKWPIVGHRIPTAFHIVFFSWFRCIYCGTSIRLKQ